MLLNVNGKSLVIDFRHIIGESGGNNGMTGCYFSIAKRKTIITGMAVCSLTDTYSRRIGRKLALLRAMQQHPLTRDDKPLRTAIWQEFFAHCKM